MTGICVDPLCEGPGWTKRQDAQVSADSQADDSRG